MQAAYHQLTESMTLVPRFIDFDKLMMEESR